MHGKNLFFRNTRFKLLIVALIVLGSLFSLLGLGTPSRRAQAQGLPTSTGTPRNASRTALSSQTPVAVAWSSSLHVVFVGSTGGNIWYARKDDSNYNWNALVNLGMPPGNKYPGFQSVTATSWGDNRLDVFAVAYGGNVWHKYLTGTTWGPTNTWEDVGGSSLSPYSILSSGIRAVSWGNGRLDVFPTKSGTVCNDVSCSAPLQNYFHKWWDNGWGSSQLGWETLDTSLSVNYVGVVSRGPGLLEVFGSNANNVIVHKTFNGSWSAWSEIGGVTGKDIAPTAWGTNRTDIFVRGYNDTHLWHNAWTGGTWSASNWEDLGGDSPYAPGAATWGVNRLDTFEARTSGTLPGVYHRGWNGSSWDSWAYCGGPSNLSAAPKIVARNGNRLEIFTVNSSGYIWHISHNGTTTINDWDYVNP